MRKEITLKTNKKQSGILPRHMIEMQVVIAGMRIVVGLDFESSCA